MFTVTGGKQPCLLFLKRRDLIPFLFYLRRCHKAHPHPLKEA